MTALRHAPATQRNREPILAVLREVLPRSGQLLEVASGTGEHAAFMAPRLWPTLTWQPSEVDPEALAIIDAWTRADPAGNIRPAILLDVTRTDWPIDRPAAVFAANLLHIAPWSIAQGLFAGAARLLEGRGPLVLYGPFKRHGRHTAPTNEIFDRSLRARNPACGVRCVDSELDGLAASLGLTRDRVVQMPANNLLVLWRKLPVGSG